MSESPWRKKRPKKSIFEHERLTLDDIGARVRWLLENDAEFYIKGQVEKIERVARDLVSYLDDLEDMHSIVMKIRNKKIEPLI